MKIGDLVRHKDGKFGIIEWPHNGSSWWHRKQGLSKKIAILMTDTGEIVWWSHNDFEVICEGG